jgi:chorismate mutase
MQNRLSEYRSRIDDIDTAIIDLLENRLDLAKEIAKIKRDNNLTVVDPDRESLIINKISTSVSFEYSKYLTPEIISNIWKQILLASKALMHETTN